MFRFRDYSIPKKLTWMNMLVSGAALSLACAAFVAYGLATFRESLVANLSIQAQVVGSNSISALLFNDPGSAEKTLSALQAAPNIEYASIYTPNGQPFAAYWRDQARPAASLPSIPAVQTEIHWFKDRQITVVRPIVFQGKPAGLVCIRSDLRQWTARLQRYAIIVAAVLLVSLMAAWLTSTVIRRAIADPIGRLAETARIVSREKNYSVRAPLTSNHDELAALIATFNEMLAQIQERDTALQFEIAERKQAEDAVKESLATSETALKELADQKFALDQHALVAVTDVQGTITYANDKFCAVSQYSEDELIGQNHRIVNSGHHPREFFQQMYHTIANGKVWHGEIKNRAKDGSIYWMDTTIVPFVGADGKPRQYVAIRTDITERKRADEALHESQERFRLLLDGVKDYAIYMLDPGGHVVSWNEGAARLKGYRSEEILGKHFSCFYVPEDRESGKPSRELQESLAKGRFEAQAQRVRKDGSAFWANVVITPLYDDSGALRGFSKVARDITQQKADEGEIRELNDELEHRVVERTAQLETANKELEAFSYSVSHDLRAPLRHISGFSQMLVEEFGSTLDPGAQHYLDRIQAGTQKMGLLVDELLNLARVGRHALNRQATKLNAIVAEVVAILQPDTAGRQVEWVIADLPAVECDPVLVKQVFQNLLANALKFTRPRADGNAQAGASAPPSHAIIEISHKEEEDGQPVFMVRDNGVGFSMKYVDKLFGVFQRLHTADEFEGTGIGLVTVQRIVQKHGGRVWAEGEPDKGATFYFTLSVGKQVESKSNGATAGGRL
jgi:PAS domain S-box-containing protein